MATINLSEYIEKVRTHLPNLSSENNIWFIRANSGQYYQDFNINNSIAI